MSPAAELRVGVVGYGVMGKAHCYAYRVARAAPCGWLPARSGGALAGF